MALAISHGFMICVTPLPFIVWFRGIAMELTCKGFCPQLATYLGHVHIAATQRYLTMTPELLSEASKRFQRYAMEEPHE